MNKHLCYGIFNDKIDVYYKCVKPSNRLADSIHSANFNTFTNYSAVNFTAVISMSKTEKKNIKTKSSLITDNSKMKYPLKTYIIKLKIAFYVCARARKANAVRTIVRWDEKKISLVIRSYFWHSVSIFSFIRSAIDKPTIDIHFHWCFYLVCDNFELMKTFSVSFLLNLKQKMARKKIIVFLLLFCLLLFLYLKRVNVFLDA